MSIFTKIRIAVLSTPIKQAEARVRDVRTFVDKHAGLVSAGAASLGALIGSAAGPAGAKAGGIIGGLVGGAAESGVKHSANKRKKKNAEKTLEEQRLQEQRRLDEESRRAQAEIARRRAELNDAEQKGHAAAGNLNQEAKAASAGISAQEQQILDILDHVRNRRLDHLLNFVLAADAGLRNQLSNRPLAVCHPDDREHVIVILSTTPQAQQQPGPGLGL